MNTLKQLPDPQYHRLFHEQEKYAQQERHDDTGGTDQEVHRIDTLKVALAGEDISAV